MAVITNRYRRTRHWIGSLDASIDGYTIDGSRRRPADRRVPVWATGTVEEKLPADPIEEHHCLHDGRTGRIGETLHDAPALVKQVIESCHGER